MDKIPLMHPPPPRTVFTTSKYSGGDGGALGTIFARDHWFPLCWWARKNSQSYHSCRVFVSDQHPCRRNCLSTRLSQMIPLSHSPAACLTSGGHLDLYWHISHPHPSAGTSWAVLVRFSLASLPRLFLPFLAGGNTYLSFATSILFCPQIFPSFFA